MPIVVRQKGREGGGHHHPPWKTFYINGLRLCILNKGLPSDILATHSSEYKNSPPSLTLKASLWTGHPSRKDTNSWLQAHLLYVLLPLTKGHLSNWG